MAYRRRKSFRRRRGSRRVFAKLSRGGYRL